MPPNARPPPAGPRSGEWAARHRRVFRVAGRGITAVAGGDGGGLGANIQRPERLHLHSTARRTPPAPGARIGADGTAPASNTSIAPISCARSTCNRASPSQVARSRTKSSSMAADWPKTGAYMSRSRLATPMSVGANGGDVICRARKDVVGKEQTPRSTRRSGMRDVGRTWHRARATCLRRPG